MQARGGFSGVARVGILVMLGLGFLLLAAQAGAIPKKIAYQGRLTDAGGNPLPGDHTVFFSLHNTESGGIMLWSETKTVTADSNGVFSTILGSTTPIQISFADPKWLEITVDAQLVSPRREIVSVASAFNAQNADSLGGLAPGSYAPASHTHYALVAADGDPVNALYVDADGEVGIGTTTPNHKLVVINALATSGAIAINGRATSTAEVEAYGIRGDVASTGTSLPGAGVLGYASSTAGGACGVRGETTAQTGSGVFGWASHTTGRNYGVQGMTSSPNGYAGYFWGGRNFFQGRVGIGTDDPGIDLHIGRDVNDLIGIKIHNTNMSGYSSEGIVFANEDGEVAGLRLYDNNSTYSDAMILYNNRPSGNIRLVTGDVERMRIDQYGRVGIGVTGPVEELQVAGAIRVDGTDTPLKLFANTSAYIDFRSSSTQPIGLRLETSNRTWYLINGIGGSDIMGLYDSSGPAGYERALCIDGPTHRVGIGTGTSSPTSRLDVANDTGYNQFRMRTSYTPTSTTDPNGAVGDMAWDDSFIYVKTSAGWKRAALSTWGL